MGYRSAVEATGAIVHEYEQFGDYQGTWGMIVTHEGKRCLIMGAFGSCSGCDAFEAEFGYNDQPREENGKYYTNQYGNNEITKDQYDDLISNYNERLSNFGKHYLETVWDKWDIENRLKNISDDEWYDKEIKDLLNWALLLI